MKINYDCRYFKGNSPCKFHKENINIHCSNCPFYEKVNYKILIIKLSADGDVLRTTSILPGLKEKYKNSHITWITEKQAIPLLLNNNYIDDILEYSTETLNYLLICEFDLVLCLDNDRKSCAISEATKAKEKLGFGINKSGTIYPYNKEAQAWYKMALFDDIKKRNKKSYPQIMAEICKIKNYSKPILNLTKEEYKFKENFMKLKKIKKDYIKIGLNTGAGTRWEKKKWGEKNFLSLIELIDKHLNKYHILLYGGPQEKEINNYIMKNSKVKLINTGYNNTLREFSALVDICDILVTGDTLCLHIADALNKKVIVLLGPTSHHEIELSNGVKIIPDIDCLCCYKQTCRKIPSCMDLIKPEMVLDKIKEMIK